MKKLIDLFRRSGSPASTISNAKPLEIKPPPLPAAVTAPINLDALANFYNGLYIAVPDDALEQMAIEHYCFLLYAFRDMPEIGPEGVERIREARRELFAITSDRQGKLLPDEQIDRTRVVQWLFDNESDLALVYNGLMAPWSELREKAGFGEGGYTLYRPAEEPVWHHMKDNEQHVGLYTTGIETFIKIFEKIPAMRQAISKANGAPSLTHNR